MAKSDEPLTLHLDFVGYRGLDVDVYDISEPIEIQLQENYRFTDFHRLQAFQRPRELG